MNDYKRAMDNCPVPEALETRLVEKLSDVQPKAKVFRPRSLGRKVLLAALVAVLLTLTVGAVAVIANWDNIFVTRFGTEAETSQMGQAAFQEVNVTSVCDDVTLTVRQSLSDDKTVYLVLDYQLPEGVDVERVAAAMEFAEDEVVSLPTIWYCGPTDKTWEELKAEEQALWKENKWNHEGCSKYRQQSRFLKEILLRGGGNSQTSTQGFDPETRTMTLLCQYTTDEKISLSDQPLTLVVTPPGLDLKSGEEISLADHPAMVIFQPIQNAQSVTASYRAEDESLSADVTVSTFAITVDSWYGYNDSAELLHSTSLVFRDGSVVPVRELTRGMCGGSSENSASFTATFREILDVDTVKAVRIGSVNIPLE